MIKKTKHKIVKNFVFSDKYNVNVVSISENGSNSKFYNVTLDSEIIVKTKKGSIIKIRDNNFRSSEDAKETLEQLNSVLSELNDMKEVYEFIVNQGDVTFEREEKFKRLT